MGWRAGGGVGKGVWHVGLGQICVWHLIACMRQVLVHPDGQSAVEDGHSISARALVCVTTQHIHGTRAALMNGEVRDLSLSSGCLDHPEST